MSKARTRPLRERLPLETVAVDLAIRRVKPEELFALYGLRDSDRLAFDVAVRRLTWEQLAEEHGLTPERAAEISERERWPQLDALIKEIQAGRFAGPRRLLGA